MEEWEKLYIVYGHDFKGNYEVSDCGDVRSIDHYVNANTGTRLVKGRILSYDIGKSGYKRVGLSDSGRVRKTVNVHTLVMLAFVGDADGLVINHKDENKLNNKLNNLEYVTQKQNLNYKNAQKRRVHTRTFKVGYFTETGVSFFGNITKAECLTGIDRHKIRKSINSGGLIDCWKDIKTKTGFENEEVSWQLTL